MDYIIKGIDQESGIVAASRLEAMAMKRKEYYFRTDRDGTYPVRRGVLHPPCGNCPTRGGWTPPPTTSLDSACW